MQVFFDCSLWGEEKGRPCDTVQTVNAGFTAGGLKRVIPVIYHFEQGIVFDILTIIEIEAVKAYYEKYRDLEKMAGGLSDAMEQKIRQENPCQGVEIQEISLNGGSGIQEICKSSRWHLPGFEKAMEDQDVKELINGYPDYLEEDSCFFCERVLVKTAESWGKKPLHAMEIKTRRQYRTETLEWESEILPGEEACLSFIHPGTQRRHQVFVYDTEAADSSALNTEFYFFTGTAEIVPPLPEGDRLMFESSISYVKSRRSGKMKAGSASVIGGCSGPVAIAVCGTENQKARHGGEIQSCFSKLFQSREEARSIFYITGLEYMVREGETIPVFREERR